MPWMDENYLYYKCFTAASKVYILIIFTAQLMSQVGIFFMVQFSGSSCTSGSGIQASVYMAERFCSCRRDCEQV